MNLFDYIKYQSTDLSNIQELKLLPEELIRNTYTTIRLGSLFCDGLIFTQHSIGCSYITLTYEDDNENVKTIFNNELKKYYKIHHEPV